MQLVAMRAVLSRKGVVPRVRDGSVFGKCVWASFVNGGHGYGGFLPRLGPLLDKRTGAYWSPFACVEVESIYTSYYSRTFILHSSST